MKQDDLEWLGTWYGQQCDGRWEQEKGMLLEPCERAGWRLSIDLRGTDAAGAAPRRLHMRPIDGPWLRCTIHAQSFDGEGVDVEELIGVFRRWVDARSSLTEAASAG